MKLRYLLLSITVALTLVFAGCAGSSSSSGNTTPPPAITLSSITLSSSAASVAAGLTAQFSATGHYSDGSSKALTSGLSWSSSDSSVAVVDSTGKVTGLKIGNATITAASGSVNGNQGFSVTAAILQSISVGASVGSVPAGFTSQFTATGKFSDNSSQVLSGVTWSSSNSAVAAIDAASGLATGVKAGNATITATSASVSGSLALTVTSAVLQSISVSPASASIAAGLPDQFTATGSFSDKTQMVLSSVSWSSSDPTIATIDAVSGLAKGLKSGDVTITATVTSISGHGGLSVTAAVLDSIDVSAANNVTSAKAGDTIQYTATGHFSDGTVTDLSSSATWNSSNAAAATITSTGLASALNTAASTNISAKSAGVSGSVGLTVAALASVKVGPIGPAVVAGNTENFTATGTYSDGTMADVTSRVAWSSGATGVATINSSGVATGVAQGFALISASEFSIADSTALTVCPSGTITPPFNGNFVFSLTGSASNIPQFYVGLLTSDGAGNLSGVMDANLGSGVVTNENISGSYTMFPDGRGDMTLNSVTLGSRSLRFVLYASEQKGRLVQFDSGSVLFGSFEQQSAGPFGNGSANAVYAFRLGGMSSSTAPISRIGLFTANGSGSISNLESDVNNNGSLSFSSGMTGSYSISSNGRGSVTLLGGDTEDFAVYMVSNSKMYMVQTDTGAVNEFAGIAEMQVGSSFSNSTLANGYALAVQDTPIGGRDLFAKMGAIAFDGAGNLACNSLAPCPQDEKLPTNRTNEVTGGTYSIDSTGRGTLEEVTSSGNEDYIFYVVSPSKVYLLDQASGAAIGDVNSQSSGSFTAASFNGTYAFAEAQVGHSNDSGIARIAANGAGSVSGAADLDVSNNPKSIVFGGTYIVSPKGQNTINLNSTVGSSSYIMYIISNSSSIGLGVSPDPLGLADIQ